MCDRGREGTLTFCSLSHFCSLLLTFAHFLLTFCSHFAHILTTLVQGTQLCQEQEEVLSRSIGSLAELQRDAVSVSDLAQRVHVDYE